MQSGGSLEDQLANKEREWKDLMSATVSQYKKAQEDCNFYRTCYERLREDFQFNLAILEERDRELARYDRLTAKALTVNQNRQKEEEHIHVQAGGHRDTYIQEKEKGFCKSQYRLHLNKVICMTDEALKLTMDHERVKCDLQKKIHESERQQNIQRQEMTADFQKELRDQKHYFNMKVDDMQSLLSSQDLKVKLMYEEIKVCRQILVQTTQDLSVSKQFYDHIETQLQHKEQHMENISSVKDSRIKDLEDKLTMMEMKMKEEEEKYVKKYQDVLKALKDSELQQEIRCHAQSHHLQKAEKRIIKLQKNMEALHDTIKKKEKTIHWYEQQLSASLEREKKLEIMRAQIEFEWQRCCENMTEHFHRNEQLIQGLIQNKNQAKEEVTDKIEELQDLVVVPPSTNMRDQSVQCLTPTEDSEKICLQKQNAEFQVMVSQMRKDMEALLLQYHVQSQASLPPTSHHGLSPQISTHLSPQTNDIHQKISQANVEDSTVLHKQGGLQPEKNVNATLMSLVGTEKQLQEEKQQQSSGIISGDEVKNAQGHSVQRVRLKRAALCITRLIEEKQHLIEMCNRLRGMTSSSGFKELDFSTEKLQEQHHDLTNLEQHQCQLASQEQQCGEGASHLTEQEEANAKETTANSPSQGTGRPEISKNPLTQSEVKQTQSSVSVDPNLRQSIESLQSIWDLLDYGLSSSTFSEEDEAEPNRKEPAESGAADDQMMVCGITAPVHSQPDKLLQKRNLCTTAQKTTGKLNPRPKIRNYNIKD